MSRFTIALLVALALPGFVIASSTMAESVLAQEEQPPRGENLDENQPVEPPVVPRARPSRRQITRLLSVPNMWGDFGGGIGLIGVPQFGVPGTVAPFSSGGTIGHIKIGENNSPMPRCRVYFDYNFYNDPVLGVGDISRYIFGFEHVFYDGLSSVELRAPFASTLSSDQVVSPLIDQGVEFGNLSVIGKVILWRDASCLVSGGLGIATPTADNSRMFLPDSTQVVNVNNDSVILQPFIAAMSTRHPQWFWQAFVEWTVDANGKPVEFDLLDEGLTRVGVLQNATLMFVDLGIGYRLCENNFSRGISAIHPIFEIHYGTTIQNADVVAAGGFAVSGNHTSRFDVVNLTLGADIVFGRNLHIRPAIVIPLSEGDNQLFDYEAGLQVNLQL
jgi:hypothetical protein